MPPATTSPINASSPPASPAATSPAPMDGKAIKATSFGVKKPAKKKKPKNDGSKHNQKARLALRKMHVFFKAHRGDDECKDMTFVDQQKVLGKLWKASPENPKNSSA